MKRFDKDGDDKLRYSEFCYAFLPSDSFHASLLAKKAPLTMYPQALIPKEQIFYPETTSLFLHRLPVIFRNPFLLYFEGYKYHEIADLLTEPLGTIKSRIHFARKLLKMQLSRY